MTTEQAITLALQHHQAGRLAEAEALYRQILAVRPDHAEALHRLGVLACQHGRHDLAIDFIRRAVTLEPNNSVAHSDLGEAWRRAGRLEEAAASYRRALQINPAFAAAHYNLGNVLLQRGHCDEAIAAYRHALHFQPDLAEACNNLGTALRQQHRVEEAVAAWRCAVRLRPDYLEARTNLGAALAQQGNADEALANYNRVLQLQPSYPEAHFNLGNLYWQCGQRDEAMTAWRRALELRPNFAEVHYNLGNALKDDGRLDEAIAAYEQAARLQLRHPELHNNLGIVLAELGRIDEAIAAYRRALELRPEYPAACNNLGVALLGQGELHEAIAVFRRAIQLKPDFHDAHSNLIITALYHPDFDRRALREECRRWDEQHARPLRKATSIYSNVPDPSRRLKVGYVSPDFRDTVVGRNLVPLFRCHDRQQLEILCYSQVAKPDHLTEVFRRRADVWRDTTGVADEVLAEMIRRDGVDILVDLALHTAGNRLLVFARQPAPVQVSFAAYPESTGLEAIGWRMSDRSLELGVEEERLPSGSDFHSVAREQVSFIESFWCYDPCGVALDVNPSPARISGRVTFGCLNNFCKVNESVLRLWAKVLMMVPESRLILLSPLGSHRQKVWEILKRAAVEEQRVEFVAPCPRRDYLELYQRLDLVLDPFPYNGHTTSLDALWMGVPVVSLAGERAVSRGGLSQLSNLGLRELVAFSQDEYVATASALARDLPRLGELRATLRTRMEASVLMDAPRFARNIEIAYRTMWEQWCGENQS